MPVSLKSVNGNKFVFGEEFELIIKPFDQNEIDFHNSLTSEHGPITSVNLAYNLNLRCRNAFFDVADKVGTVDADGYREYSLAIDVNNIEEKLTWRASIALDGIKDCVTSDHSTITFFYDDGILDGGYIEYSDGFKDHFMSTGGFEPDENYTPVSKSLTAAFYVPDNIVPEFSFILDDWKEMHAKYGVYPKFNTKITGTATGTYGASIVSVQWGCGIPNLPNSFLVMYSDVISSSENGLVTSTNTADLKYHPTLGRYIWAIVTDSRNRKKEFKTVDIYNDPQFIDYASPTVTINESYRCNEDGIRNDNGTFAAVVFSATINHNIQNANIAYIVVASSSEGTVSTELTDLSNTKTVENYKAIIKLNSYNVNYTLGVVTNDGVTRYKKSVSIPSLQVFLELNKQANSIGLGAVAEGQNLLTIGLLTRFKDGCNIIEYAELTLPKTGWANNAQEIRSTLPYRNASLIVSPTPEYYREYCENGILLNSTEPHVNGTIDLEFICDSIPSEDLKVNILALYRF